MKNKTITLVLILSMFMTITNTIAYEVNISNIDYPESVREGDIIKINVLFDYEYETAELYGDHICIIYTITHDSLTWPYLPQITVDVPITVTTPSSIEISIDTDEIGLDIIDEDVIFHFKIGYGVGKYVATIYTDWHEVTIINTNINTAQLIYICSGSALAGILLIFLAYYLIKKRK